MTCFLARIGSLEVRLASQTLWSSGKRKRGDWMCAECTRRRALRQRRAYADSSLKIDAAQLVFPTRSSQDYDNEEKVPTRRDSWATGQLHWKPWGLAVANNEADSSDYAASQNDAVITTEDKQEELWEELEEASQSVSNERDPVRTPRRTDEFLIGSRNLSLLQIDYAASLPKALADGNADMVARCLYAAQRKNDLNFMREMPRATFTECLRTLLPANFTNPLAAAHLEISDAMAINLGFSPMHEVASQYAKLLKDILGMRRVVNAHVGLEEYRMLLQAANDLGDKYLSRQVWHLLHIDGIVPDTACYNSMMAVNIWHGVFHAQTRHKIRVIDFHQMARKTERLGVDFASYRVGKGGLKEQVTHVFSDMLRSGAVANEESFCNVIMAASREGDLAMVKTVLRNAWNIDVDVQAAGNDEATSQPKSLSPNSPLYPTSKLLFTLAHAFGVNNDIPTALRLVDFVARHYEISIDSEVWDQLFEWTFVLASTRTGIKAQSDGTRTGKLPPQSVLSLWETMTGPPYFVQPTMGMYNHLIKNLADRDALPILQEKMREGHALYDTSRRLAREAFDQLKSAAKSTTSIGDPSLQKLRREWEYLDLIRKRNFFWCRRWLRLLLSTMRSFRRVDGSEDWALRSIPEILWEWRHLAPPSVWYDIASGVVEVELVTPNDIEESRRQRKDRDNERVNVLEKVPLFVSEGWVKYSPPPARDA